MKAHSLLTQVVPAINNELERINYGGCGHFAYELATLLTAKGIKADIVLVDWAYYHQQSVTRMIERLEVKDINEAYRLLFSGHYDKYCDPCFGHLGVVVDGKLYDCEGLLSKAVISDPIEHDVMKMALYNKDSLWNPTFLDSNSGIGGGAVFKMREFLAKAFNCKVTL